MLKSCKAIVKLVLVMALFISTVACTEKEPEPEKKEKPVLYLYPEVETAVEVSLDMPDELICSYPMYNNGWKVVAHPDGKIIDTSDGKEYSYLFWESESSYEWKIPNGFVIEGSNTAEFLQDKLSYMGLTPREYNEFIVYWLPRMEQNKYNLIHFANVEYSEMIKLNIDPKPDSVIRIFMVYKGLDDTMEIEEQVINKSVRNGFTAVEWGGTEVSQ